MRKEPAARSKQAGANQLWSVNAPRRALGFEGRQPPTYVAAAAAYGLGKLEAAASLIEIVEAAERLWSARENAEAKVQEALVTDRDRSGPA